MRNFVLIRGWDNARGAALDESKPGGGILTGAQRRIEKTSP
jgi:hypothetical protein